MKHVQYLHYGAPEELRVDEVPPRDAGMGLASYRNRRRARVMAGRAAHHALEGSAKRAIRFIPERAGDRTDGFAARQAASGEQHPPAREVFDRSVADQLPKSRRETGSRHADFRSFRPSSIS
jgi:hypothetical protein